MTFFKFQYREKRLNDERELMEQRVASLTEELHSTHEDLLTVRRENVTRLSQMQRDIDEKNDTVRQLVRFRIQLLSSVIV
jgi:hypothetical protein